eukprot:153561-Chlamydomonas_euryale.AAC.1
MGCVAVHTVWIGLQSRLWCPHRVIRSAAGQRAPAAQQPRSNRKPWPKPNRGQCPNRPGGSRQTAVWVAPWLAT